MESRTILLAALLTTLTACGKDDAEIDPGVRPDEGYFGQQEAGTQTEECTEPGTVCVQLLIPEELDQTPRNLNVSFYESLPAFGPPNAVGVELNEPDLVAGEVLSATLSDGDLRGDFLILAIMFMPDGGTFIPLAGVDYIAETTDPITLDGEPQNVDEVLELKLVE